MVRFLSGMFLLFAEPPVGGWMNMVGLSEDSLGLAFLVRRLGGQNEPGTG